MHSPSDKRDESANCTRIADMPSSSSGYPMGRSHGIPLARGAIFRNRSVAADRPSASADLPLKLAGAVYDYNDLQDSTPISPYPASASTKARRLDTILADTHSSSDKENVATNVDPLIILADEQRKAYRDQQKVKNRLSIGGIHQAWGQLGNPTSESALLNAESFGEEATGFLKKGREFPEYAFFGVKPRRQKGKGVLSEGTRRLWEGVWRFLPCVGCA